MHHKWKESINFVYNKQWEIRGPTPDKKVPLSEKDDFIIRNQMSRLLQEHVFITKIAACWIP